MAKSSGPTFDELMLNLKQGKFAPLYFLSGEEPFFIDQLSDFIEHHAIAEEERSFNQTLVFGNELNALELESIAKRYPMMAEKQVVIVKEAQNLKNFENLLNYCQAPVPSTILVLCYKNKKIDGRSKLATVLKKNAIFFESNKLYDNQVAPWLIKYVRSKNQLISDKAANLLADNIGNDLSAIRNALDKLLILCPAGKEISPELIEKNIGISKDFNVFELINAVGSKNILKANQIANYFGSNEKKHPLVLTMGQLQSLFSDIITIHYLKDKSKANVAAALKKNPFFVDPLLAAARNYSAGKTVKIMSYLREYDLKSKGLGSTGATSDGDLLRELLFKIMH